MSRFKSPHRSQTSQLIPLSVGSGALAIAVSMFIGLPGMGRQPGIGLILILVGLHLSVISIRRIWLGTPPAEKAEEMINGDGPSGN